MLLLLMCIDSAISASLLILLHKFLLSLIFNFSFLKVFYVPLRNEYGDNNLHTNQDLTKRFDEDLSNKHLIVVCKQKKFTNQIFFYFN